MLSVLYPSSAPNTGTNTNNGDSVGEDTRGNSCQDTIMQRRRESGVR